ncbi:hypothetical protein I3843_04G166500 [Carya illinoinensis]|nr:hypothetical protein I3843_04G166500 [Carya illinoinensis]
MKMKVLWWLILLSYTQCHRVFADQIFPVHKIEFHPEYSPFHPDDDQESVVMPNKNGENFICFLPKLEKAKSGKPQEGWWSYEFCHQKKLHQVHSEDDKVVQEFVLGEYNAEVTAAFSQNISEISTLKDPRSKDASQRYHAHQYKWNHVRFVCLESRAMISSLTELSTCKYALTVQCPMLCKHPILFQEERPVWHTINCNVLPKDFKETKVGEESKEKLILMVTENDGLSIHD